MGRLRSNTELRELVNSPDQLRKAYALEALLKLKDYSVFPEVVEFLSNRPDPSMEFRITRGSLPYIGQRIVQQIRLIRDPSLVPFLEDFALSSKPMTKRNALEALGQISATRSAAVFLKLLDDPEPLIVYGALKGLVSLAGPESRSFALPSISLFMSAPKDYARKCREWWQNEGQKEMDLRSHRK